MGVAVTAAKVAAAASPALFRKATRLCFPPPCEEDEEEEAEQLTTLRPDEPPAVITAPGVRMVGFQVEHIGNPIQKDKWSGFIYFNIIVAD